MLIQSKKAEQDTLLAVANQMCAAIRTAPKTQGKDYLDSCIVTGGELAKLANQTEALGIEKNLPSFVRDAGNLRSSSAAVLVGVRNVVHGINETCNYCGLGNCKKCAEQGGSCAFSAMDLGIAIGSAVAIAADNRIDNRIMFSAGRAAMDLGYLHEDFGMVIAIPLSVSGKSPYFDRKKST